MAEPRKKIWRNATGGNNDAATVATAGTATVGVAAKMVGVANTTTASGGDNGGGGGGGGASGADVAEGAAEEATLVQQPGQLVAALFPRLTPPAMPMARGRFFA